MGNNGGGGVQVVNRGVKAGLTVIVDSDAVSHVTSGRRAFDREELFAATKALK